MVFRTFILWTALCTPFIAAAVVEMDWETLQNPAVESQLNNEIVNIRGFLYQNNYGEFFLASRPNLKSCCVGSDAMMNEQIKIIGDSLIPTSSVITLEGEIKVKQLEGYKGEGRKYFLMNHARIIETAHHSVLKMVLIALLIFFGIIMARAYMETF